MAYKHWKKQTVHQREALLILLSMYLVKAVPAVNLKVNTNENRMLQIP